MKTTTLPLVLFFLLFAFTNISFPEAVNAVHCEPVIDVEGDEVLYGTEYYIYSSPFPNATVLGITIQDNTCPAVVLSDPGNALPVLFSPFPTGPCNDSQVVRIDDSLTVSFNLTSICNTSTIWGTSFNLSLPYWYVAVGGNNEGYVFKIASYNIGENVYKLLYCPYNPLCTCPCIDVGYLFEKGVLYLILGGQPVPIVLRPANSSVISQLQWM